MSFSNGLHLEAAGLCHQRSSSVNQLRHLEVTATCQSPPSSTKPKQLSHQRTAAGFKKVRLAVKKPFDKRSCCKVGHSQEPFSIKLLENLHISEHFWLFQKRVNVNFLYCKAAVSLRLSHGALGFLGWGHVALRGCRALHGSLHRLFASHGAFHRGNGSF